MQQYIEAANDNATRTTADCVLPSGIRVLICSLTQEQLLNVIETAVEESRLMIHTEIVTNPNDQMLQQQLRSTKAFDYAMRNIVNFKWMIAEATLRGLADHIIIKYQVVPWKSNT